MLAPYFSVIRAVHIDCVVLSGGLFFVRGVMRIGGVPAANHRVLRYASYGIDTVLLIAGICLTLIMQQFPITDAWLTTKLGLLLVYITLGIVALRRARTRAGQVTAFVAALMTYSLIIGVAITHRPAGWFSLLR